MKQGLSNRFFCVACTRESEPGKARCICGGAVLPFRGFAMMRVLMSQ